MADDIEIECSLGEMSLEVKAPAGSAVSIFEQIWENRLDEKRAAEAFERQELEGRVHRDW